MRKLLAAVLLAPVPAAAFPDGAPWDAVGGRGCADCHFGEAIVEDSPALRLEGLPERVEPGTTWRLRLRFDDPEAAAAGYLLAILDGERDAGTLTARDEGSETQGARARSTAPQARTWLLDWQAPETLPETGLTAHIQANAANGDGSPFGDRVHRRTIEIEIGAGAGAGAGAGDRGHAAGSRDEARSHPIDR